MDKVGLCVSAQCVFFEAICLTCVHCIRITRTSIHVRTSVLIVFKDAHMYVYMFVHVYIFTLVSCIHTFTHLCLHTGTHVCTFTHTHDAHTHSQVEQEKRELEARLGATPPPSPSDRNTPAFLNSRIMQLSEEVEKLKKMLERAESESE